MIYKEILNYGPLYKTAVSAPSHATVFLNQLYRLDVV